MAVTPYGINWSAMANASINFSVETNPQQLITDITSTANSGTNHLIAYLILFGLLAILYWVFSDKTPLGDFMYDDARALVISLGICAIVGITMLEVGFLTNFKAVAMFGILFMLNVIFIEIYENKE